MGAGPPLPASFDVSTLDVVSPHGLHEVGVRISVADGRYRRTKCVILAPRIIVVNNFKVSLCVCSGARQSRGTPRNDRRQIDAFDAELAIAPHPIGNGARHRQRARPTIPVVVEKGHQAGWI